jgi:hypothetical protein
MDLFVYNYSDTFHLFGIIVVKNSRCILKEGVYFIKSKILSVY